MTSKTRIEIKKSPNETNANFVRRFSRQMKEADIIRQAKQSMVSKRKTSKLNAKLSALHKMTKRKEYEKLRKLGKVK